MSEIENIAEYLRRYGITSKVVKKADNADEETTSLGVIQLTGTSINEVEIVRERYYGDDSSGHTARIYFRITYAEPPTAGSRKATTARTKLVIGKKILGMFGEKVIDIQWVGNNHIERALNQDIDLRMMLMESSYKPEYQDIAIFPSHSSRGLESVDIVSPLGPAAQFNIQIYEKIAKHVRAVIGAF